jgi:hypothetical protein
MASMIGKSATEVTKEALAKQSIKRFVDPRDIPALALFLTSDSAHSKMIPIDGDPGHRANLSLHSLTDDVATVKRAKDAV